jgi:hypothetical protein
VKTTNIKNKKKGEDEETKGILRMIFGVIAGITVVMYYIGIYFAFYDVDPEEEKVRNKKKKNRNHND